MNSIQLKIRVNTLEVTYTTDGKIVVKGECSFKFWDKGENQTKSLSFQAFGQPALSLQQAGTGSVHVAQGRLNIYPRSENNPNELPVLTISTAIPVAAAQSPTTPSAKVSELAMAGSSNGKVEVALENIPF